MKIMIMKTKENAETTTGNERKMHERSRIDKPIRIIGLRPTLSEREPLIGEKIV